MKLFKIIQLNWSFYKNFMFFSAIITGFCLRAIWLYGLSAFFGVFWCKLISLGLIYYFVNSNKKNEYYYYQNLGIGKAILWTATLSFDFILFILLLVLTYHLK